MIFLVSSFITHRLGNDSLLLRQPAPSGRHLNQWKQWHAVSALNCLSLRRRHLATGQICACLGRCSCVGLKQQSVNEAMVVRKDVWSKIIALAARGGLNFVI